MQFRIVDENNDWTFGQGKSNYARENEAIKLNIKTRLQEWVSDCFFNLTAGIDYLNRLEFNQIGLLNLEIKRLIINTEGVVELTDYSFNLDEDRKFTATYKVKTIYSRSIEIEDEFSPI